MLKHLTEQATLPKRVVIVGAAGFVGAAVRRRLEKDRCVLLPLARADLDLLSDSASGHLAQSFHPDDALVIISAKAPAKTHSDVVANVQMMSAVCVALEHRPVSQVVYVSSDAVYADSEKPLTEESCAQPASVHGAMHLTREVMLRNSFAGPLCLLRPTLIYGAADPHNGYGPNRFLRLAIDRKDIVLFGEGEEQRDHVSIDDVAEVVLRVLLCRSEGVLNVATGHVTSFREIAETIAGYVAPSVAVRGSPRNGQMPHRGYRPFDIGASERAFPDFRYRSLADGLKRMHNDLVEGARTIEPSQKIRS